MPGLLPLIIQHVGMSQGMFMIRIIILAIIAEMLGCNADTRGIRNIFNIILLLSNAVILAVAKHLGYPKAYRR